MFCHDFFGVSGVCDQVSFQFFEVCPAVILVFAVVNYPPSLRPDDVCFGD